ncbi:hypothetical protein F0U62_22085 [Cystobacter fuscus]|uniref:hypothetical protein n=1 Tax=Cystobacter fuscus TaxID=43 RepID=UPI002B2EE9F6|nr:hypothetical protein F0U62_22085 [Cystobacter fuscus]
MADVIYYSTGEIFWVTDPPKDTQLHGGVPYGFPPVPPDNLFTYSRSAHALTEAGHTVIGAFGRMRQEVRESAEQQDPEFLALGQLPHPERTVLVIIATDFGKDRIPFTAKEVQSLERFRARGGGIYVTWDHGPLGYQAMVELGLASPVEPEPEEPLRPAMAFSNDATSTARVEADGFKLMKNGQRERVRVHLSPGPPAGHLQKIVPAELLYDKPARPHPIFNGVGGGDGIWIPAHSHEGKLRIKASLVTGLDESQLPPGVRAMAIHLPIMETSFDSFAVMARQDPEKQPDGSTRGGVIWDTSFHHLVDINWSPDGKVPWDAFVPFSAESLWLRQFSPELFTARLDRGMRRLFVNAVKWLAGELHDSPAHQLGLRTSVHSLSREAALLRSEPAIRERLTIGGPL